MVVCNLTILVANIYIDLLSIVLEKVGYRPLFPLLYNIHVSLIYMYHIVTLYSSMIIVSGYSDAIVM